MYRWTVMVAIALALIVSLFWVLQSPEPPPLRAPGADAPAAQPAAAATGADAEAAASRHARERTAVADARPVPESGPARAATGALLVHVVFSDGSLAPGITLYLSAMPLARPLARAQSDAAGSARFSEVAPGKVQLASDRGARKDFEIIAGAQQEVRFELEAGVAVEGVVHDGAGVTVPGADIWLTSFQRPWMAGAVVARSDAQGAFRLRGVPARQSLGALAPGRAPSELVDLELLDTRTQPVRVTLVVGASGGALTGRVVDPRGEGVAGALVAVGSPERTRDSRTSGTMVERWSPRTVLTDDGGRFSLASLKPGKHPVEVWAARFPSWHGQCEIVANQAATLDVELAAGVTVAGTVRGAGGEPLAGAVVRAFPVAIREDYLQFGQYDYESTFGCPSAIADAAGGYRLERAAPGAIHLFAGPGGDRRASGPVPWAAAVLEGAPGATLEWNPIVEPGHTIAGVVRHRDGVPMPGLFVSAIESGSGKQQAVTTDRQGRFRFVRLQRKSYDLSVQFWSAPPGTPPLGQRDVWPDQAEVELVAAFDAPEKVASGTVRGRVQDAGSRLARASALAVILQTSNRSWRHDAQIDGDAFTFTKVEPGQLRVIVMSGDHPILAGDPFELQPAEDKDLGTLVTEPGGRLRLRLERGAGAEALRPKVHLRQGDLSHGRTVEPGEATEWSVDNLSPGTYSISAWGPGIAWAKCQGRVVAGIDTDATLRLRAGADREILVDYPAEQRLRRIHVHDDAGVTYVDSKPEAAVRRPFRMKLCLPLGKFTFEAATESGEAKLEFAMTSLAAGQPPVRIEVR